MRKLYVIIAVILLAVISCTKILDKPVETDVQMKTSTTSLENYYVFTSLSEVFKTFEDNGYILDDVDQITNKLNNYEADEGVDFSKFELKRFKEGTYNFVSTSANKQFKVSYVFQKNINKFRVVGTACTCTGCSDGCSPRRKQNGDCYCTVCVFVGSGVKCTKSESVGAGVSN